MLNDVWHSVVRYFGCVGCRILWTKFKFSRVKFCVIGGGMAPMEEMVKKGRASGMTGLWIEEIMGIDYAC